MAVAETARVTVERLDEFKDVIQPIDGDATDKNFLSISQLSIADVHDYISEAQAAQTIVAQPDVTKRGINILPFVSVPIVMRQESTRTGGSVLDATTKLGATGHLYSGMKTSSEAKGERIRESWEAFATQGDLIATRTEDAFEPARAAQAIADALARGGLFHHVPVINLGDGINEHPTQAMGDALMVYEYFSSLDRPLEGLTYVQVGDHERYRAHHSNLYMAHLMGMHVIAIESAVSRVLPQFVELLGDNLERTDDLDAAMQVADILDIGRMPDEYTDIKNPAEVERSRQLREDYLRWRIDYDRVQKMPKRSMVKHPRPRGPELDPSADRDRRLHDVKQMAYQVPMRMAIIARHLGVSIKEAVESRA